jgi:2-keto-4-pentenoate hydratase
VIAEQQLRDYDRHHPGGIFEDPTFAIDLEGAYALQLATARLRERRGERIAGYKIGCVSVAVQEQLGLRQPVLGHLFSTEIHPSGVRLDERRFEAPAIEGEIALRIRHEIPDVSWLLRNVFEAIESVLVVIELHNWVFRRPQPTAEELVASNALHAGVVCAPETSVRDLDPFSGVAIRLIRNGELLGESGEHKLVHDPLESLVALVELLATRGRVVEAGHIVLTGSRLPLQSVRSGDTVRVESDWLAPATVSFS